MASARRTGTNENISTYGASGMGRDYTALGTWEADTDNDLVTAMTSEVLECYDDEVFDDTITVAGATTDSSYFRIIRPASGEEHDGTPNTGVRFASTTTTTLFTLNEDFFNLQDISIDLNLNSASNGRGVVLSPNTDEMNVVGVFTKVVNAGAGNGWGFVINSISSAALVDCIVYECDDIGFFGNTGSDSMIYNCTADACGIGIFGDAGATTTVINTRGTNSTSADFSGTFEMASDYNLSEDGSAPGGNSIASATTVSYVDADNDDYHITSTDDGFQAGIDLSADSGFPFNDDIDFETIIVWSIGADAQVAAGPTPGHSYQHQYLDLGNIGFTRSWSN